MCDMIHIVIYLYMRVIYYHLFLFNRYFRINSDSIVILEVVIFILY